VPEYGYRKSWSRQYRGLLIFLLDQSGSMQEPLQIGGKSYTNGQMATAALNNLIVSVISKSPPDPERGGRRDYCDILVLGYGDQVTHLLHDGHGNPISLRELDRSPRGYRDVIVDRYDSQLGRTVRAQDKQPYWIEYTANSNYTEMAKALQMTYTAINTWLNAEPSRSRSFPPVVVNITDGMHNGTGDPSAEAGRLRQLSTNEGYVVLFSCHLTSRAQQGIAFPRTVQPINDYVTDTEERDWAKQLFNMSSVIPETMVRKARDSFNVQLNDGARGFIYNADPSELVNFLGWGTQPN
jgi:hypothetical protein